MIRLASTGGVDFVNCSVKMISPYIIMDCWLLSHCPVVSKHRTALLQRSTWIFALWPSQLSRKRQIIIAKSNFRGSIFLHSTFYVPALNIIYKRGAVGIVAGSGCVMSNRYLVRFTFHKWKIQADLINVQEGCMTRGVYCSRNTRQIHSSGVLVEQPRLI